MLTDETAEYEELKIPIPILSLKNCNIPRSMKAKIEELETNSKLKNVRDFYRA
jgi:hypothetical protein